MPHGKNGEYTVTLPQEILGQLRVFTHYIWWKSPDDSLYFPRYLIAK